MHRAVIGRLVQRVVHHRLDRAIGQPRLGAVIPACVLVPSSQAGDNCVEFAARNWHLGRSGRASLSPRVVRALVESGTYGREDDPADEGHNHEQQAQGEQTDHQDD